MNRVAVVVILMLILFGAVYLVKVKNAQVNSTVNQIKQNVAPQSSLPSDPLQISQMQKKNYPGSDLKIKETLTDGSNYHQYIASYLSEGLKIYGLLTVPTANKPAGGFPVIIFNHGYIAPEQYRTTERYVAYVDALARAGYIVFKPDYRGNGNSEGQPEGAYYSSAYTTDDLNAISTLKKYPDANPNKIGVWGHSMGGNITLRDLVVDPKDIKAAVIWGGVVGSYDDLMNNWQRAVPFKPSASELALRNRYRQNLIQKYGTPKDNPQFWNSIDPTKHLDLVSAPVQLDHGTADEEVPLHFSQSLEEGLKKAGKTVELYTYEGADHNISSPNFEIAMQRTITFFDKYLK